VNPVRTGLAGWALAMVFPSAVSSSRSLIPRVEVPRAVIVGQPAACAAVDLGGLKPPKAMIARATVQRRGPPRGVSHTL
jgi:hypothetical protein